MARYPLPTAIQAGLKDDRQRKGYIEPTPEQGVPPCPSYLDRIAKREWREITKHLASMNLLAKADRAALELYCNAYSRYRKCLKKIQENGGESYYDEHHNRYAQLPESRAIRPLTEECRKLLIEFGLTPAARARMRVKEEKKDQTGWGQFKAAS